MAVEDSVFAGCDFVCLLLLSFFWAITGDAPNDAANSANTNMASKLRWAILTTGARDIDWILRRMAVGSVQLAQRRPAILNIPGIFGEREE